MSIRVLFLCTGNSARSQLAETILNQKGAGRFVAESAGSHPAARVEPLAIEALESHGFVWTGHPPRGLDGLEQQPWDFVITVCDRARESCPIFPGQPVMVHWGMPDPASAAGDVPERRRAFEEALLLIRRRIELLVGLPVEKLERSALEQRVRGIGEESQVHPAGFHFELDPEARLVRISGEGDPQSPEWIELFDQILAQPGFRPGTDFLIDRRGITSIPTSETVDAIMEYYMSRREQLGQCRIASVTTNPAVYGMTRMAEVFAERTTVTVRVFRDMESAYQWLRPAEPFPPTHDPR